MEEYIRPVHMADKIYLRQSWQSSEGEVVRSAGQQSYQFDVQGYQRSQINILPRPDQTQSVLSITADPPPTLLPSPPIRASRIGAIPDYAAFFHPQYQPFETYAHPLKVATPPPSPNRKRKHEEAIHPMQYHATMNHQIKRLRQSNQELQALVERNNKTFKRKTGFATRNHQIRQKRRKTTVTFIIGFGYFRNFNKENKTFRQVRV